jgi:hypothetical protein
MAVSMRNAKVGDVYSVPLSNKVAGYFQFIGLDMTMLNSEVVRVFKCGGGPHDHIGKCSVAAGETDFYVHVAIKWGIQMGLWRYESNCPVEVDINQISFRDSADYGNPDIKFSRNWYTWKVGDNQKYVGELNHEQLNHDIGIVVSPPDIVEKMRTGSYSFVYPTS